MHKPVTPQFEPQVHTRDTIVEITSTGDIEPLLAAPQRNLTKLGLFVDDNTTGYRDTAFDPKKEDKFIGHQEMLETTGDALLGADDSKPAIDLPNSAEKVVPAAQALLKHQTLFTELAPAAAAQVRWDQMVLAVDRAEKVERRLEHLKRRQENLEILYAHILTYLDNTVITAAKQADSTIKSHRGLTLALDKVSERVSGAAEKGQVTRRAVARALKRAGQKAVTLTAATPAVAPPAVAPAAPVKDKP